MKFLKFKILIFSLLISVISYAQLPSKVLVGYWENWGTLRLKDVDNPPKMYGLRLLYLLALYFNNIGK